MTNQQLLAANYNCTDAVDSAYGAGAYNTCVTSTVQPGAPDTGSFWVQVTSGQFSLIIPVIVAFAIVAAFAITMMRKKKSKN
jgi:hypothetical protein